MFEMRYKGYVGEVKFDDEASLFHGEVANIRDVITFQGTSVSELREALAESVESYLEFCAARGESPELGRSVEDLLREDLIQTFGKFDEVRAIAVGKHLQEERVYLLTCMKRHYDYELVERLTEAEFDLHERFPQLCIFSHYIPVGDFPIEPYMYYGGTIIWQRDV